MGLVSIGDKAIKLACLKIKPSCEFAVADFLREKSPQQGVDRIAFLKSFGHWDLILVHEQDDFFPSIAKIGPIPDIVNTTVFHCYNYTTEKLSDISLIESIENHIFTALVFLKIDLTNGSKTINDIETRIINLLWEQFGNNVKIIGTLGWNEFILVVYSNDLNFILKKLYDLNFHPVDSDSIPCDIVKSFTQLSINQSKLVNLNIESNLEESFLCDKLKNSLGENVILGGNHLPSLFVSAKPIHYKMLTQYWRNISFDYDIKVFYGDYDFYIRPKREIELALFLTHLLTFRHIYQDLIYSTQTNFSFDDCPIGMEESPACSIKDQPTPKPPINRDFGWSYKELEESLDSNVAPTLASTFYRLKAGLQDPLLSDCFKSLKNAPQFIIRASEESKKHLRKGDIIYSAQNSVRMLNEGIELRLYGTPGNLYRNFAHFGSVGGGKQRAIAALELLPKHIFHSFNIKNVQAHEWEGFVIITESWFQIFQEILSVPPEALLDPSLLWCEYHECCHMLMENTKLISPFTDSRIQAFVEIHPAYKSGAKNLVKEIIAEIIGYMFGFFGDLKLFKELLWGYVIGFAELRAERSDLWTYIFRTFCVEMYVRMYCDDTDLEFRLDRELLQRTTKMYELYIEHMNEFFEKDFVKTSIKAPLYQKFVNASKSKAAMSAPRIKFLKHIFDYIYEINSIATRKSGRGFFPDASGRNSDNTKLIMRKILAGEVHWDRIESIEGVIYNFILKHRLGEIKLRQKIAMILTLWNSSVKFDSLYKE